MNEILPQPHNPRESTSISWKKASLKCPQCEAAVNRDNHYCGKCGAHLVVCYECKSPNVELAQFCHTCGHPMMVSHAENDTESMLAGKTQDFNLLDQAALAIVKLREVIESIERLELAHQIAYSRSVSIRGE